ncbi:MAG: response regulator transcription factor [Halioglobus sp.]|nr:response regulator transcription factor [Halioglobus sp.]
MARVRNIFIVDDHPLIRQGLRQLFQAEAGLEVCGEAGSIETALDAIRCTPVDLLILDISLPDGSGFDLLKRLRISQPGLPILMCSMHEESFFAERALSAGAQGYVSKLDAPNQLIEAVEAVLAGKYYVGKVFGADELDAYLDLSDADSPRSPVEKLTNRELEVFEQIGAGIETAQIARHLNLSVKTVETHRRHIKDKLGVITSAELTRQAIYWRMRRDVVHYADDG